MSPPNDGNGRSSELRKDSIFGRWVIFSPARGRRPSDFKSSSCSTIKSLSNPTNPSKSISSAISTPSCPFCIGREQDCAPEVFRFPAGASEWKLRVIENLYPALRREEDPPQSDPEEDKSIRGYGFHDVIIESPYHDVHLSDLSSVDASEVILAYKERFLQLAALGNIKYVQVRLLIFFELIDVISCLFIFLMMHDVLSSLE